MKSGRLVPDELVQQLVIERIVAARTASAATCSTAFPAPLPQAKMLDELLAERGQALDLAVKIDVDEDVLLERLAGRGRDDDDAGDRRRAAASSIDRAHPSRWPRTIAAAACCARSTGTARPTRCSSASWTVESADGARSSAAVACGT